MRGTCLRLAFRLFRLIWRTMQRRATVILSVLGALEALLLARLVLRLFAARPDNSVFAGLLLLTAPLRAPLAALDAQQPAFGAVFELSTLALCMLIGLAIIAVAVLACREASAKLSSA